MGDIIWGINALGHDASISVIKDNEILFAAHAERYSKLKYDRHLNTFIINEALSYGYPKAIAWADKPILKKTRQLYSGRLSRLIDPFPSTYIKSFGITAPITPFRHHKCHAAAGYLTSKFDNSAILVIDSIGEWDTISIWKGKGENINLLESVKYPNSLGLLYSAFTLRLGYKPNSDEYIVMGMAAYGKPIYVEQIVNDFISNSSQFKLKDNVHLGIAKYLPNAKPEDLAASIQLVSENVIDSYLKRAYELTQSNNIVYMGGVALNCLANRLLPKYFKHIWIMPNPGDAGNSLGAAALLSGKHLNWVSPYLGTRLESNVDVTALVDDLTKGKIVGLATGRAEFGPRALGNRSLLADPRLPNIQEKLNLIKKREKFRPFAPVILEDYALNYFDMSIPTSPYMQIVFDVKKDAFPGITHVDKTARVQTVTYNQHPLMHTILTEFLSKTGSPMLINTSLNIKGQPIVNDETDKKLFSDNYNITVY